VIKTTLKSRATDKTVVADKTLYESAFLTATNTHALTTINFKNALEELSLASLMDMKEFVWHDRTTKDKKMPLLAEKLQPYKDMMAVQSKLNVAMDAFKTMLVEDLEATCGDADGVIQMEKVKDAITSRIAIAESLGMDD
jgi:hypothetical protein